MTIPVTPKYNLSCPDKAQHVRQNPAFTDRVHCWENKHFRDRWSSLLSVDELVGAVVDKLTTAGVHSGAVSLPHRRGGDDGGSVARSLRGHDG